MQDTRYIDERNRVFTATSSELGENIKFSNDNVIVAEGDSLALIKRIPDNSISLILTDPPYHSTKKENITNDTAFKNDTEFLKWVAEYCTEFKRILRPNGSLYFFCSSTMAAHIEVLMSVQFNILSHVVWNKPNDPGFEGWKQKMNKSALRQWYSHSERILFAEPAVEGNLKRSGFGHFLKEKRTQSGLSGHKLTELTGAYGKVNHGGAVSNWEAGRNVPSREQYSKICDAIISTGKVEEMPAYENVIRPFEIDSTVEFTDVWNFFSVRPYKGKHPAEKPQDMLKHCILSSSYEHDIVLDCFAGSGSTAIAALDTNRRTISIDIEPHWANYIIERVKQHKPNETETSKAKKATTAKKAKKAPTLKKAPKKKEVAELPSLFA